MQGNHVSLETLREALAELVRTYTGSKKQAEAVAALRSSGQWASIERQFHNHWAEKINQDQIDPLILFNSPTAIEFRFARDCLGKLEGKKILDLGCGAGEAAVYFATQNACVTAVDISPKMIEVTKELAHKYGVQGGVNAMVASAQDLPFSPATFDLVFGSSVLHHVDMQQAAREVRRLLKPVGKSVFIEPLAYNPVIEVYRRMADQVRTPTENPVTFGDIEKLESEFTQVRHTEFHLFTLLIFIWFFVGERIHPNADRYWKKFVRSGNNYALAFKPLHAIDRVALRWLPYLRRFCWATIIECSQ